MGMLKKSKDIWGKNSSWLYNDRKLFFWCHKTASSMKILCDRKKSFFHSNCDENESSAVMKMRVLLWRRWELRWQAGSVIVGDGCSDVPMEIWMPLAHSVTDTVNKKINNRVCDSMPFCHYPREMDHRRLSSAYITNYRKIHLPEYKKGKSNFLCKRIRKMHNMHFFHIHICKCCIFTHTDNSPVSATYHMISIQLTYKTNGFHYFGEL